MAFPRTVFQERFLGKSPTLDCIPICRPLAGKVPRMVPGKVYGEGFPANLLIGYLMTSLFGPMSCVHVFADVSKPGDETHLLDESSNAKSIGSYFGLLKK